MASRSVVLSASLNGAAGSKPLTSAPIRSDSRSSCILRPPPIILLPKKRVVQSGVTRMVLRRPSPAGASIVVTSQVGASRPSGPA